MRSRRILASLALAASLALPLAPSGCKNAAQAVAGVFTTEELACMVDGLVVGQLSGTPEQIAAGLQAVCGGRLTSLTQDVVAFVEQWQATEPPARAHWADWARARRETTQPPKTSAPPGAVPPS